MIGREEKNVFVSFVVRERLRSACFENNKTKVLCPAIGRNVELFPGTSLSLAETFLGRERIKTWIFPYAREKSVKRQNFFKHTCVCVIVPRGKWIESMKGGREEHSRILWRSSTEKIGRVYTHRAGTNAIFSSSERRGGKKRFCVNASAHIPFEEYRLLEIIKRNKFTRKIFNSIHKRVSARLPTRCITRIHFHFHSSNFNVTFHPDEDKRDIAAKRFNLQGWTRTASFLLLPFLSILIKIPLQIFEIRTTALSFPFQDFARWFDRWKSGNRWKPTSVLNCKFRSHSVRGFDPKPRSRMATGCEVTSWLT